jgi:FKBP-type peptidyl-prolyl cis-trans isomerase SlyD
MYKGYKMSISENEVVSIEYKVIDSSTSEEVDSNIGAEPLEFIVGKGMIISGLENEVIKLDKGEKSDILVNPEDAYGEYKDDLLQTLAKEQFAGVDLVENMSLYGTDDQGQTVQVKVVSFTNDDVTIDYNHPLAGKTLMFSVTLLDVRDATQDEISSGIIGGHTHDGGCCGGGHCDTPELEPVKNDSCCGGGHCS